jgi:hypothetical protein
MSALVVSNSTNGRFAPFAVIRRSDLMEYRHDVVLRDVGERGAQKFQPGADFAAFDEQHASES